jgi:hypothetical protein
MNFSEFFDEEDSRMNSFFKMMFFEEMMRREFGRGMFDDDEDEDDEEDEYEDEPCDCPNCRFRNQRNSSHVFTNNFREEETIFLDLKSTKVSPFEIHLRWRNPKNKEFDLTVYSEEEGYEKVIYRGRGTGTVADDLKSSTNYICLFYCFT